MTGLSPQESTLINRSFWIAILVNMVWINISEVFRYILFIMPMMRETFPQIINIAPMNMPVFLVWGLWDSVLVFAVTGWSLLYMERFGYSKYHAIWAGTFVWLSVFVILWLGLFNMNLATPKMVFIGLSLSWLELVIAALITMRLCARS